MYPVEHDSTSKSPSPAKRDDEKYLCKQAMKSIDFENISLVSISCVVCKLYMFKNTKGVWKELQTSPFSNKQIF